VEAVISGEPGRTLAQDDEQERRWRLLLREETSGLPLLQRGAVAIGLDDSQQS